MTLGTNPFASSGVPVELAWEVESSDEMSIDDYESSDENTPEPSKPPRRLSPDERREIAEEHHSRQSIFAILKEASLIRHAIVQSLEDDEDDAEKADADASLYVDHHKSRSPSHSPSPPPPVVPERECREEAPGKIPWSKRLCERMQSERECPRPHNNKECQQTETSPPPDNNSLRETTLSHRNFNLSKRVCDRLQHWEEK